MNVQTFCNADTKSNYCKIFILVSIYFTIAITPYILQRNIVQILHINSLRDFDLMYE